MPSRSLSTAPDLEPAVALLRWLSTLGGGIESMLGGMAYDLACAIVSQQRLKKSQRQLIDEVVAGAEGLLGKKLVDVLERELAEAVNAEYPNLEYVAQRRLALRYLEAGTCQ